MAKSFSSSTVRRRSRSSRRAAGFCFYFFREMAQGFCGIEGDRSRRDSACPAATSRLPANLHCDAGRARLTSGSNPCPALGFGDAASAAGRAYRRFFHVFRRGQHFLRTEGQAVHLLVFSKGAVRSGRRLHRCRAARLPAEFRHPSRFPSAPSRESRAAGAAPAAQEVIFNLGEVVEVIFHGRSAGRTREAEMSARRHHSLISAADRFAASSVLRRRLSPMRNPCAPAHCVPR